MMHSYLGHPGPNPGKLHPSFCARAIPTHMSPLNACHGGTAALNYRHVTTWEDHGGLFAHARPLAHMWVDAAGNQQNWNCWDFHIFSYWGPGAPGSCAPCVGTASLLFFRDVLPSWGPRARLTAETGHQRQASNSVPTKQQLRQQLSC